jgi:hypothetical protein
MLSVDPSVIHQLSKCTNVFRLEIRLKRADGVRALNGYKSDILTIKMHSVFPHGSLYPKRPDKHEDSEWEVRKRL